MKQNFPKARVADIKHNIHNVEVVSVCVSTICYCLKYFMRQQNGLGGIKTPPNALFLWLDMSWGNVNIKKSCTKKDVMHVV